MPYISPQRRELVVTQQPPKQGVNEPLNVGELTYQLTVVIEEYRHIHGTKYQTFAEIVGALEQAKDEFQRRVVHPYEDEKLAASGDVYVPPCALNPEYHDALLTQYLALPRRGLVPAGTDYLACQHCRKVLLDERANESELAG